MWPLQPSICEMKRLYVYSQWQGSGVGRRLVEAAIAAARSASYHCVCLDTLNRLAAANGLYRSLGFREIEACYTNPSPGVVYMERDLV